MLLAGRGRGTWPLACHAIALASMASTLTFKQHYAMDLPAGAALAIAAWWLAGRWVKAGAMTATAAGQAGCTCSAGDAGTFSPPK
jgi:membrane-associated phospholipid phosphatase